MIAVNDFVSQAELNEITEDIEHDSHEPLKQAPTASAGNILSLLEGRQDMYNKALASAKASGDASKARRLDRQLKVCFSNVSQTSFD